MISAQWKSDKMTDGFAVLTSSKNVEMVYQSKRPRMIKICDQRVVAEIENIVIVNVNL